MGQLIVAGGGAVIGSYFGPVGARIGWAIGSLVGGVLFPSRGPQSEGPRLTDARQQLSTYGAPIPRVFGRVAITGCLMWDGGVQVISRTDEIGGKGGPTATQVTYSYFRTFAILICEGPIASLSRIICNGKAFYDARDDTDVTAAVASASFLQYFRFYNGSETQLPDPTMEAALGVGNVPAYRGYSYIVFTDLLQEFVDNLPLAAQQWQFEVTRVGAPSTGMRVVDIFHPPIEGFWIFSVLDGLIRVGFADPNVGTNVHTLDGTFIVTDTRSNDELDWPEPYPGPDGTLGVVRLYDGSRVRVSGGGLLVSNPATLLYAEAGGALGPIITALDLLPQSKYLDALAPCVDRRHLIAWTSTVAGVPNQYHLLRWDAQLVDWTLVSEGTFSGLTGGILNAFSAASQSHQWYSAVVESDLTHIWTMRSNSGPEIYLYEIDESGEMIDAGYFIDPGMPASSDGNCCYADRGIFFGICEQFLYVLTRLDGTGDNTETLDDVASDICLRPGLDADEIDVTELAGIDVDGFVMGATMAGRAAFNHLERAYWFDSVESGGKIKFVRRGASPVVSIPMADLGAVPYGSESAQLVETKDTDDDQIPSALNLAYLAKDANYQPGVQTANSEISPVQQPENIELALVLTDTAARQIAEVLLDNVRMGRKKRSFSVGKKYSYLEPTDIVEAEDGQAEYQVRIDELSASAGVLALNTSDDDAAIYFPVSSGGAIIDDSVILMSGPTKFVLLDLPLLRDIDNDAGYYEAARGYLPTWTGHQLYDSPDGGTYSPIFASSTVATIGTCLTTLGDFAQGNYADPQVLRVALLGGTLTSASAAELEDGANFAAIGTEDNGFEVVQFKFATLVSTNVYDISGFRRGRFGSEHRIDDHIANETFVLLTESTIERVVQSAGSINVERSYKAVSFGGRLADAMVKEFTNTAAGLKPYSPVDVHASGWGGNLAITWRRRGRLYNLWANSVDVPLGEDTELYELEIWNAGNTAVLRTITGITSENTTYSSANQVTDFGTNPTSLNLRIYQISAQVGRGYPSVVTLEE